MDKILEINGLRDNISQSTSSKSLMGTVSTGFDKCGKIDIELNKDEDCPKNNSSTTCDNECKADIKVILSSSCESNEESILEKIDTGFGEDQKLVIECTKPVYKTHLCKESYLGEFKSESEKNLVRNNIDVYSKSETHLIIQKNFSNFITKNEFEESIRDLDYTTSKLTSQVNYIIPENLFK